MIIALVIFIILSVLEFVVIISLIEIDNSINDEISNLKHELEDAKEDNKRLNSSMVVVYDALKNVRDQNENDPNFKIWAKTYAAVVLKYVDEYHE